MLVLFLLQKEVGFLLLG